MNVCLHKRLDDAEKMLDELERRVEQFATGKGERSAEAIAAEVEPLQEVIEEAQRLLFDEQDEVVDAPAPEPEEGSETEAADKGEAEDAAGVRGDAASHKADGALQAEGEPAAVGDADDGALDPELAAWAERKGQLEQRSRVIEARMFEAAAKRTSPALNELSAATSEQDQFLARAVDALEAHFLADQNPSTLVRIARLNIQRREVKRARAYVRKALELAQAADDTVKVKEAQDVLEMLASNPNIKDKGKCFIATAAMGSDSAPEVRQLREFRDNVLMKSAAGRFVVAAYYQAAPPVARLLEREPVLRRATADFIIKPLAKAASLIKCDK